MERSNTNTNTNTNTAVLVTEALDNCRSSEELQKPTLDAAWRGHGPGSSSGSWVKTQLHQNEFEDYLSTLAWQPVAEFPNGRILEATSDMDMFVSALPSSEVDQAAEVRIDLSEPGHPAAVLASEDGAKKTNILTLIVGLEVGDDEDLKGLGLKGPFVMTWFPGHSTPRSTPDGELHDGDIVSVAQAAAHGFRTIKIAH